MVKAKGTRENGGAYVVFGLSHENLDRLRDGEPITFNLSELGMGDCEVLIMSGSTEQAIANALKISRH